MQFGSDDRTCAKNGLCVVYPFAEADGPTNMALDEALLEAVMADRSAAQLRTYGWTVPTLSLGYFQHIADAKTDPRWRSVPIVRRPTGGGAIWHHHELTYALALPAEHPLARRSEDLYHTVHAALARVLRERGLAVERRGAESSRKIEGSRPFLCFTDRDAEDIVTSGRKIVGSAQRRRSGVVLQHGSMMLVRSSFAPELIGACDLAPISSDARDWSTPINASIPESLGLQPVNRPYSDSLLSRARELARTVYGNEHWTCKR
jgi:lipoate-protein ligase A